MNKQNMVDAVNRIVAKGTRIVSFNYSGKPRNVLIGSNRALGQPRWGKVVNRGLREYRGKLYAVGYVNNESKRTFKTFALDKIEDPSFA